MPDLDPDLVNLATHAARDPQKWDRVLDHIMSVTGAPAAMITLRDKKNCQIVNDDALENEYHSPLVRGFPIEVVTYYLNELRTIDPWAEAQICHYPSRPILMSKVCDPQQVNDKRFFNWLNALGIFDTVAFELEAMPDYWTACNFFLTSTTDSERTKLRSYATIHQELLKNTWQASQEILRGHQLRNSALDAFGQMDIPACIIDARNAVISSNTAFKEVVKTGEIALIGANKILSLGHTTEVVNDDTWGLTDVARHDSPIHGFKVIAKPYNPDPLYHNKKKKFRLLTLQPINGTGSNAGTSYNLDQLSGLERQLFTAIKAGKSVKEAGKVIGYGRSQTYKIWDGVKDKLNIASAHQIR